MPLVRLVAQALVAADPRRKLKLIDAAPSLDALRVPPGNRLEALKQDRKGQHSIRLNSQWRLCFRWERDGAADVQSVDCH